jgi:ribosomal protein L44E
MPKAKTTELRIKCTKCKDFTQSIEPVVIKRFGANKFNIKVACSICKKYKTKTLNEMQRKLLPKEIQDMPENTEIVNNIEKDGGLFPLIPLIGAIAAGISALAGVGGVTANAILKSKENNEQERHNKAVEDIARGSGIEETSPIAGVMGSPGYDDDALIDKSIKFLHGKGFKISV